MDLEKLISRQNKIAEMVRHLAQGARPKMTAELDKLSDDELNERYRLEMQARADTARRKAERDEMLRPFNSALARAPDYAHWGRLDSWSLDEGISLVLERAPEYLSLKDIEYNQNVSAFARQYLRIRSMATRTIALNQPLILGMTNLPRVFLEWAISKDLSVPDVLRSQVVKHAGDVMDSRALIASLKARLAEREALIASLEAQAKERDAAPPIWPWGEHSTPLLVALAAAGRRFWTNYDPSDHTTAKTNAIVSEWLQNEHGIVRSTADAMASILRDPSIKTGPRGG